MKQLCSAFELLNFIYRPIRNLMYLGVVHKCVYCICMSEYCGLQTCAHEEE